MMSNKRIKKKWYKLFSDWITSGKSIYAFNWTYRGHYRPEVEAYHAMIEKYGYDITLDDSDVDEPDEHDPDPYDKIALQALKRLHNQQ